MKRAMRYFFLVMGILLAVLADGRAGERYGKLDKDSIIDYSMRHIAAFKEEFGRRAAALKAFDGTFVELDYQYFDPMTAEEEQNHERFLNGRLDDERTALHISGFLKDIERVRAKLATAEAEAFPKWEEQNVDKRREFEEMKADLFGTDVTAANLGVILDRSPSMKPHLEKLRLKIGERFPSAHFVEVDGSFLDRPGDNPWFYATPADWENPFDSRWYCPSIPEDKIYRFIRGCELDTASAMRAMVLAHGVDAIYWFCDFDDEVQEETVAEVGRMILEHDVKLYVHTLKRRPPNLLTELIERSGGELVRERVR